MRKLIFSANAFSKFLLNSNGSNLREYSGYGGKGRANCFVFTSGKSACHFNTASDSFVQSRYKEINDKTIAVAQKHLSDFGVFDFMVEKQKILITDDRFHSLSVDQQQSLLSLPLSLRDIFDIEALPIAQFQDTTVRPLYFDNSGVSFVADKVFATPQTLFDYGVYTLKKGDCVISSEAFWGTGSLQLRLLLFSKSMEADSHALKSRMVQYLIDTFKLPLASHWNQLCLAHDNFYSDTRGVTFVEGFLEAALEFSNILFKFHEQNLLIRDDVVKWALKSKSSFHQTGKVKIKLENGEWIRLNEMYTDRECGDNVVIKF